MFAKRLKELRLEKDLKQSELAQILGISNSTVGMYEQGRRYPDLETIRKISNFFDVSVDYLVGNTNIKKFEDFPEEVKELAHLLAKYDIDQNDIVELLNALIESDGENAKDKLNLMKQLVKK